VYLQVVFWYVADLRLAFSLHVANHYISLVAYEIELGLTANCSFVRTQILDFKDRILTRTRPFIFG
jgi:hypothetical protein